MGDRICPTKNIVVLVNQCFRLVFIELGQQIIFFSKVYAITAYLSPMHLACIYEWSLKPWELATLILSGFTIAVCYFYSFMS